MKINKRLEKLYPWKTRWEARAKKVATMIPDGSSVLDIGGGKCGLEKMLKPSLYISLDKRRWTDHTIVEDLNSPSFPKWKPVQSDGSLLYFDYVVCAGVIEYIASKRLFLEKLKRFGRVLILTARVGSLDVKNKRIEVPFGELESLIVESGWHIEESGTVTQGYEASEKQRIYRCTKQ